MPENKSEQKQRSQERQEIIDLAKENLWNIDNRWSEEEQRQNARQVAEKLLHLVQGEADQSETIPEPPASETDIVSPVADTLLADDFEVPEWQVKGESFPIVGRRFDAAEFVEYVKWVRANEEYSWQPSGITMHHTAFPDLSIRPKGFTEQHMLNMRHGYLNDNGWSCGPHIYTDDHGIWVFNPLSARGIHAVSYNNTRYGIEMLGNFNKADDFDDERGLQSRKNGMLAAAVLMKHAGISTAKLNFHRHDPETSKSCPGKKIFFSSFEAEVLAMVESV